MKQIIYNKGNRSLERTMKWLCAAFFILQSSFFISSCSDSYMEDLNTDKSKTSVSEPAYQLTFALLSTYGSFGSMEAVRAYVAPYTQMYGGSWNAANAGGANLYKNDVSQSLWNVHYQNGIKNLVDAEYNCKDDKAMLGAIRLHKAYLFNILTDVYGDIPVMQAGKAAHGGIITPEYDKQEDIYNYLFDEIDASIELFRQDLNSLTLKKADVTSMGGDVKMWIRYANSFKMRLAMRISDVAPELAKTKFLEAMQGEGALDPIENAYVKYLHQPFTFESSNEDVDFRVNAFAEIIYGQDKTQPTSFGMTLYDYLRDEKDPRLHHYCRFLNDNFRDNTDPRIGREDFTEEVLAAEYDNDDNTKGVQMVPACWAWYDQDQGYFPWPNADCVTKSQHYQEFIAGREKDEVSDYYYKTVRGSVATEYVLPETPGMLVSGAEVCFLKAEAAVKGWITEDANALYQRGIEVAIGTVHNKVYAQTSTVSTTEITEYVANHTLSTDPEKAKEQINTQAWFLHFANPLEAWANLRRSDYPALYERTQFGQGQNGYQDMENNMSQPVRLYYPQEENEYNHDNYHEVIDNRMDGFSWHKRMWWDTKEQNYKTYVRN